MDRGAVKRAVSRVLRETDAEISTCPYLPRAKFVVEPCSPETGKNPVDLSFVICERTVFLTERPLEARSVGVCWSDVGGGCYQEE